MQPGLLAVTGLLLASAIWQPAAAVEMGQDGYGQVLIFPYYNARGDNDTLISVVNTTSDVKAIKAQVLEGENGRVVLGLNLYLGPSDVWTAILRVRSDGDGQPRLETNDSSCTVPQISRGDPSNNVLSTEPFTAIPDGGRQTLDRTLEGHIRVIEMGTLPSGNGDIGRNTFIGPGGVPINCQFFVDAWRDDEQTQGLFRQDPQLQMQPPTGGLSGDAVIIQVTGARAAAYDAVALDHFYVPGPEDAPSLHTAPESLTPDLGSASPLISRALVVEQQQVQIIEDTWNSGQQAVDAVLMTNQLRNHFAAEGVINGKTEWVVTFPGKQANVWQVPEPVPPFTSLFASSDEDIASCEVAEALVYDRDQQSLFDTGLLDPPPLEEMFEFCYEVNVITFNNSVQPAEDISSTEAQGLLSDLFASRLFSDTDTFRFLNLVSSNDRTTGWGQASFNGFFLDRMDITRELINPVSNRIYRGLPAVGVALRGADNRGINALFGAAVEHFYTPVILPGE